MADQDEMIELTIRMVGEWPVKVNRAAYEAAKAAGDVDEFLDPILSDLDPDNVVIEPNGCQYKPFEQPHGPSEEDKAAALSRAVDANLLTMASRSAADKCGNWRNCTCTHGCDIP